jgi:hypothetical protein
LACFDAAGAINGLIELHRRSAPPEARSQISSGRISKATRWG